MRRKIYLIFIVLLAIIIFYILKQPLNQINKYYDKNSLNINIDDKWSLNDISIEKAWEITKGSSDVVVAILDSGINLDSYEFNGRIVKPYNIELNNEDITDNNGHGTHISGIIGAEENGRGITGIAPNISIMPIKISDNGLDVDNIVSGIEYACKNGASIVNLSASIKPKIKNRYDIDWRKLEIIDKYEEMYNDTKLRDVIKKNKEVLFVFSSGNEYRSAANYPARYEEENIISVAATDMNHRLWKEGNIIYNYGSNYNKQQVDVAAPGVNIPSTSIKSIEYRTGTSMATAYVTGVAALLKSEYPQASAIEIKKAIIESSTTYKNLENKVLSGGVINAYKSLMALKNKV